MATPAASRRRWVRRESAVSRSVTLMPLSGQGSNGIQSCLGAGTRAADGAGRLILLLQDDGRIVREASPDSLLHQQTVELNQRRDRHARRPQRHAGAGGGIKHPGRHHDDLAGNHLYMNDVAAGAALHVLTPKSPFIKRVPAIVDFNHLPDMGRMTR
jgi:hypothetical protein